MEKEVCVLSQVCQLARSWGRIYPRAKMSGQRVIGVRGARWWRRSGWVALLLVSTFARSALAQSDAERATARRLANAGVEAYQQADYRQAAEKLEKAFEILKAPSVALWLARALSQQGQLVAAAERFAEAGRLPVDRGAADVQAAAQRDAAAELEALTPQIPVLVIRVPGVSASELTLSVDGRALSSAVVGEQQPVDPGAHHIEVRRGEQVASADVRLARGETKVATLSFVEPSSVAAAPASGEPPTSSAAPAPGTVAASDSAAPADSGKESRRGLGFAVAGTGVAGLAVGTVFGYLAIQAKQQQVDKCRSSSACPDRAGASAAHESAVTKGTISTIAFVAGALATTVGIVLVATDKTAAHETPGPKLSLVTNLGPSAANLRLCGEF
jgi:hypothetical protein